MKIIKKKYETFDVDYRKEINGSTYDIVGQVVVRLSDERIENLNVNVYEDKTNPSVALSTINYFEGIKGENCNINVSCKFGDENNFSNEIISDIKKELFPSRKNLK